MAIEFNDNIHVKINRPTDFRFGPFTDINQANAIIPIAQRYHGLIFGVYTTPLSIATSDVKFYYYWDGLSNSDIKELGGKPPVDGSYANQATMIAAQATQTAQYIYYDNASYWEYLGTTNGNITDYRRISFSIAGPTTNGNVLTIVAGVPTWQAPVSTSKWTDLTGGIYRDSRVLVGNTTFSDSTSKFEVFGNAKIATSSGNFTPVLTIENTGSASWDFKNVTLFVGSRGNASIIDDNTNIGIWQKSAINNNYGLLNFFNAGGLLTAYFGARFLNHTNFQSSELHFGVFGAGVPISGLIIRSTGNVNIGGASDSGDRLRVSGTVRLDTVTNAIGDIVTIDANNVLRRQTVAEIGTQIGGGGGGGTDINAVHYNVADGKNATEKNQARVNIGSTSSTPQVISTAGAINDLVTSSNNLVFTGASVVLSGIVEGLDGEEITILNASGTNLELLSQSVLSIAGNRFASGVIVPNLSIVRIKYRTTTARWVLENVGINDGRYVRKDVADTKTGNLTINAGSFALQSGTDGTLTWITNSGLSGNGGGAIRFGEAGIEAFRIGRDNVTGAGFSTPQFERPVYFYQRIDFRNGGLFGTNTGQFNTATGRMFHARSGASNESVRRDELYLNYSQTVATAGTINDLAINSDCKLLILTGCDDLTGVVFVDNTRLLRIEARGASRIIRNESTSSTAANRFSLGADLTINDGEVYQFIYTNARWRRVL